MSSDVSIFGDPELQQEIGELEVARVLGHGQRQLVVGPSRKEQHVGVVEIVAQLDLDVTQRPLLQDVAEPAAGRDRNARHRAFQARAVLFDVAPRSDRIAVLHDAQPDGVGMLPPVLQQLHDLGHAAVRAEAPHVELLPQEPGGELEILIACAQADADHSLHVILADSPSLGKRHVPGRRRPGRRRADDSRRTSATRRRRPSAMNSTAPPPHCLGTKPASV